MVAVAYNLFFSPKPLGDRLEYIGRTYSGYVPLVSDGNFSARYYYATDMSPREIVRYFKKATADDLADLDSIKHTSLPISFSLKAPTTNNPLYITYYNEGQKRAEEFNLKTNKKHVIIIQDEDYQAAKDSL